MSGNSVLRAGDRVLVGTTLVTVSEEFAVSLLPGDRIVGVAGTGALRRIPAAVSALVDSALARATTAFSRLQSCGPAAVDAFFSEAARRVMDDGVFAPVLAANAADVESARRRERSTTRLELSVSMRHGMAEGLGMWGARGGGTGDSIVVERAG
ncbi:MAG: glutamate-5-semialdehyde dehydrogenase, partial [Acidimicrobiales bacterium]